MSLSGKVCVILGGGEGLAERMARALAAARATVFLACFDSDAAKRMNEQLVNQGKQNQAVWTRSGSEQDITRVIAEVSQRFGRIDLLVNCAAQCLVLPVKETTVQDWDDVLGANLRSMFVSTRAVLDHMIRQNEGTIINVLSMPEPGEAGCMSAYFASQLGALALTEAAAMEARGTRIKVIALCPGESPDLRFATINAGRDFLHVVDPETIAMAAVKLAVGETNFSDLNRDFEPVGLVSG